MRKMCLFIPYSAIYVLISQTVFKFKIEPVAIKNFAARQIWIFCGQKYILSVMKRAHYHGK